jgi:hypothetical protein
MPLAMGDHCAFGDEGAGVFDPGKGAGSGHWSCGIDQ